MGVEQSNLVPSEVKYGFNVLRVDENSPAAAVKLVPYFEYIVSVNGVEVVQEVPNVVSEMAKNHVDRPMKIMIYNARYDISREATIFPSHAWGGKTLLGASIRFCQVSNSIDRVWHIVDVTLNSPAHISGLIPGKDWIIGSTDIALNQAEDFYNLMIHNQKRPVRLLVFNTDSDKVREVSVTPDFEWGGDGCLGCNIASGALHRIPPTPSFNENGEPSLVTAPECYNYVNSSDPSIVRPEESNRNSEAPVAINNSQMPPNLDPIPGFSKDGGDNDLFLQ